MDAMIMMFFEGCHAAGSAACALWRETDSSAEEILFRVWEWAAELDENPLFSVMDDGQRLFIRRGDIIALMAVSLYEAVYDSQALALDLHEGMSGNTSGLFSRMLQSTQLETLNNKCSNSTALPLIPNDVLGAITCADGENVAYKPNAYWFDYLQQHLSISSVGGAVFAQIRLRCAGWTIQPNWAFRGPFTTPRPSKSAESPEPGRPAAPLLFMSNRYDPATPLDNARAMSKNHPRSAVLVQESMGHCLLAGGVGPCAKNILSKYFATGEVPAEEASCEPTQGPWDKSGAAVPPLLSYAKHWIK